MRWHPRSTWAPSKRTSKWVGCTAPSKPPWVHEASLHWGVCTHMVVPATRIAVCRRPPLIHATSTDCPTSFVASYRAVCNELLPGMRSGSHLHNLIFRDKTNVSVVLVHSKTGSVFGGCTFRLFRTGTKSLILDVLVMAVCQQTGFSGHGYGTRLINYLKVTHPSLPVHVSAVSGAHTRC
jgi:hypothetical protein